MVDSAHLNNINSLLGQIREYQTQAQQGVNPAPESTPKLSDQQSTTFANAVKGAVDEVNNLQKASAVEKTAYELGTKQSLPDVVLSMQKSSLAFEATVQVRNKVLKAYEEIMNMPV